eukprot:3120208-Pyramimonas_sp.AAC.1
MCRGVPDFFPAAAHPRLTSPHTSYPLSSFLSSPALNACTASTRHHRGCAGGSLSPRPRARRSSRHSRGWSPYACQGRPGIAG